MSGVADYVCSCEVTSASREKRAAYARVANLVISRCIYDYALPAEIPYRKILRHALRRELVVIDSSARLMPFAF